MRHPEGLIDDGVMLFVYVWLFNHLSIDYVCSFKWSLSILTCCHIYQSGCVGGTDRISILLFRHNRSWLICRGEWIVPPPNSPVPWDSDRPKKTNGLLGEPVKNLPSSYFTLEQKERYKDLYFAYRIQSLHCRKRLNTAKMLW